MVAFVEFPPDELEELNKRQAPGSSGKTPKWAVEPYVSFVKNADTDTMYRIEPDGEESQRKIKLYLTKNAENIGRFVDYNQKLSNQTGMVVFKLLKEPRVKRPRAKRTNVRVPDSQRDTVEAQNNSQPGDAENSQEPVLETPHDLGEALGLYAENLVSEFIQQHSEDKSEDTDNDNSDNADETDESAEEPENTPEAKETAEVAPATRSSKRNVRK